jgi:ribonuclease HI
MKTGVGAGLLFVSPLGEHMRYAIRLHFPASNNMAEYEALLCGLKIAIEIGVKHLAGRFAARDRPSHEKCELP